MILPITPDNLFMVYESYRMSHNMPLIRQEQRLCTGLGDTRVKEIQTDWSHNMFLPHAKPFMAQYHIQWLGENLARNFNDTNSVITGWDNSPEHKDNLTSPHFKNVCFSVSNNYVVQEFSN